MKYANYFSLLLFVIFACFLTTSVEAIVGGRPVNNSHEFPYQVSVQNRMHRHMCGGGLFTEEIVLTAASCLVSRGGEWVVDHRYVLVGSIYLLETGTSAQSVPVERAIIPRDFNNAYHRNDLAVLKLARRVLHPERPYDPDWLRWQWGNDFQHTPTGIIAGYGLTMFNKNSQHAIPTNSFGRLKFAVSRIIPHEECRRAYPRFPIDSQLYFCTRLEVPSRVVPYGVCYGDNGGPLVHGRNEHAFFLGILIGHSPNCDEELGRGRPALYTNGKHLQRFISDAANHIYRDNRVINYPL